VCNIPPKGIKIWREVLNIESIQMSTSPPGHLDKSGNDHGVAMGPGGRNSNPSRTFLFATTSAMTVDEPISYYAAGIGESFSGVK
jgi:hypothetical protein